MARSYVFLVHGVGRHDVGEWDVSWRNAILAELRRYAPFDQKTAAEIEAEDICFRPISYDAVFEENFRQPWTNLAGALAGSIGVAPTANIDPERRNPSMFEPIHGSAFDIAGIGIAKFVQQDEGENDDRGDDTVTLKKLDEGVDHHGADADAAALVGGKNLY